MPKKELIKAALSAQQGFRSAIDAESALHMSNVLLLAAYEHNSAVNMRHALIKQGLLSTKQELRLLNLLLTSKLKKQSKSPTLWHYRRQLMDKVSEDDFSANRVTDDSAYLSRVNSLLRTSYYSFSGLNSTLSHEFNVILRSAEVHKHNYYAWGYARWITERELSNGLCNDTLRKLLSLTLQWISKHPSDTSGWAFFTYLGLKLDDKDRQVIMKTLDLTKNDYLASEAYYVCLRTLLRSVDVSVAQKWLGTLEKSQEEQVEVAQTDKTTLESVEQEKKRKDVFLQKQALDWYYRREPRVEKKA